MKKFTPFLITAVVALVAVAIVSRVAALRKAIFGAAIAPN